MRASFRLRQVTAIAAAPATIGAVRRRPADVGTLDQRQGLVRDWIHICKHVGAGVTKRSRERRDRT